MVPTRILIVISNPLSRVGLKSMLESLEGLSVVGDVASAPEAHSLIAELQPDIILADAGLIGVELASYLSQLAIPSRLIILGERADRELLREALKAGTSGYLLTDSTAAEIVLAIQSVARGEVFLSPKIAQNVIDDFLINPDRGRSSGGSLSPRQIQVLRLIAEGLGSRQIASRLGLSTKTVESHRTQLMAKLNIHNIAGLVQYAVRHGLVKPDA